MKLKDYEIPQYGSNDGLPPDDLEQYSLKNFDLKAYQLTQSQPDAAPMAAFCAPEPPPPAESFPPVADPVRSEPSPLALEPYDVQFGAHFNLQQPLYVAASPSQSWKLPRWVVATVGLFFASAAVLTISVCVVLLRGPSAPPTAQAAVPAAPVATTSAAPARPAGAGSPASKAPVAVTRAPSAPHPPTANLMHVDLARGPRVVVSRHPSVVRRQPYGPRRVAARSASSPVAPEETETANRRPPKDALDQLLSESAL